MSETPTHAAVPTPTPARPQHTEGSSQTDRAAQTTDRASQSERAQQSDRAQQAERTQQTERHAERTQHTDRTPDQTQRPETLSQQHVPSQHTQSQQTPQQRAQDTTEQRTSNKLEDEWQAVQYDFVDDPKAAVRKADQLVTRAIDELTTRHRSLTKQLEGNGDPQTEDLRLALHRYRELFKSLVAVK